MLQLTDLLASFETLYFVSSLQPLLLQMPDLLASFETIYYVSSLQPLLLQLPDSLAPGRASYFVALTLIVLILLQLLVPGLNVDVRIQMLHTVFVGSVTL